MTAKRALGGTLTALLLLAACATQPPQQPCPELAVKRPHGLEYETRYPDGSTRDWTVYQRGSSLAVEDLAQGVADVFRSTTPGRATRERWFLDYDRLIEYDAVEVAAEGGLSELVSLRGLFEKQAHEGTPAADSTWQCNPVSESTLEHEGAKITTWRSIDAGVVLRRRIEDQGGNVEVFTLRRVLDESEAAAFFAGRSRLDGLDYADIGDNEADPFVQHVLRRGLVEHNH